MLEHIRSLPAFQKLLTQLAGKSSHPNLSLLRSARLPVLACLYEDCHSPILYITDRSDHALTILDELSFWMPGGNILHFSEPTPLFYEQAAWGNTTRRDRLIALSELARYHQPLIKSPEKHPIIVTTARAIMTRTLPLRDFLTVSKPVQLHQNITPEKLIRSWIDLGYEPQEIVTEPGHFSKRGGVLDIWPMAEHLPIRLDFFADEVDSIRFFDPATQRKVEPLEKFLVAPAREFLPSRGLKIVPPPEEMDEFHIPKIHPFPSTIFDFLPDKAITIFDDQSLLESTINEIEEQAVRFREESIREGTLSDDFPIPYFSWAEVQDSFLDRDWIDFGFSADEEVSELAQAFAPCSRFAGRLKNLIDHLGESAIRGDRSVIISRQVSRLKELWGDNCRDLKEGFEPEFIDGTLAEGWSLTQADGSKLTLMTDSEIFGWERPAPRQKTRLTATSPEDSYADFKTGDWVVHVDYGIGRFAGLVQRSLEGAMREFLCIEYESGDQLFVPIHQADRLSRYIGPDEAPPTPTRLGTTEWTSAKERVTEAVKEVARDLLQLYTMRQVAKGHSFSADTPWQKELESSFPYIETEDQKKAIQAVKKDMEDIKPMDRLLCGDVGYGKTEVALRAAFKAVNDGKQVALLVPTTVLAQQHFETFRDRLTPFPVTVEMLSRFRTPREQDEIILRLAVGEVDIIIGTHRLLQQDVQFKDLGLIIIDEEQRFGVTHKEHFKKMRTEVDVLTLTATPIPRTLYMALTGVRDISMINTPPAERLPIITHIGPYSPKLVRQATLRELERGGQIFFVHNRVQSIEAMRTHLNRLVPEAKIGVAHGQMPENELASEMHRFTHGEIDILLCTSIIESGLDIPNANTLIVDRGDAFGLAQLYQLRGRVGRGGQRAYAYFFRHKRRAPTREGQERLEVIAENTQLGAGYSIAMRDLEMRGAGDLLGTRQHGYIAAVGFQLYTRMLAQSVREYRSAANLNHLPDTTAGIKEIRPLVNVELPVSIGIPADYVGEQTMRLRLYRRIADTQSEAEIDSLEEEFVDRFGPLPGEVKDLLFFMRVKAKAEMAGLVSVTAEGNQLVLRFPPLPTGTKSRNLPPLAPARTGKNAYWMKFKIEDNTWKTDLFCLLDDIISARIIS